MVIYESNDLGLGSIPQTRIETVIFEVGVKDVALEFLAGTIKP